MTSSERLLKRHALTEANIRPVNLVFRCAVASLNPVKPGSQSASAPLDGFARATTSASHHPTVFPIPSSLCEASTSSHKLAGNIQHGSPRQILAPCLHANKRGSRPAHAAPAEFSGPDSRRSPVVPQTERRTRSLSISRAPLDMQSAGENSFCCSI